MPPQPPSSQDRPIDQPHVPDGSSLLALFGMALAMPVVMWALIDPVRIVGIAAVVCAVVVFVRAARQFHRTDGAFHVPGTGFDVKITVSHSGR